MNKITTVITGILTITLAGFAFALSYANLYNLAAESGVAYPALIPLTIEGAVLVFSVAMLRNSLHGDDTRVLWSLIIGSSVLATGFNVYHSDTGNLVSMIMAGVPSVFLLLSFETFISQIKRIAAKSKAEQSLGEVEQALVEKQVAVDRLEQALAAKQAETASAVEQIEKALAEKQTEIALAVEQLEQHLAEKQTEIALAVEQLEQQMAEKQTEIASQMKALEADLAAKKAAKKTAAKSPKQKRQEKLRARWDPNKTNVELARELNVHVNAVANDIKELGLNGRG